MWRWTLWLSSTEMAGLAPDAPVTELPGVGPKVAERLAGLGLRSCGDVLFHLPLRYEDRTHLHPLGQLRPGRQVLVCGRVLSCAEVGRRRRSLIAVIEDGTGRLTLRFFHYYRNQLQRFRGRPQLLCFGEVRAGFDGLEMVHPEYQPVTDREPLAMAEALTPVYPAAEGIGQTLLRRLSDAVLEHTEVPELLPESPVALSLADALRYVHRPPPETDLVALSAGDHPAQQRLAFEELVAHRLSMRLIREQTRRHAAPPLPADPPLLDDLLAELPFALTAAQQRVAAEIAADLAANVPMLRLLHGDVGAGKTVIAAMAAVQCIAAGRQAAISAPTEILAEQHQRTLGGWLEPLGLKLAWLSGRVRGRAREHALQAIAGDADLVVGTHALMEDNVSFRDLGLVVIDEQHRFGVRQRLSLREKGAGDQVPHQLIMTATPIPRTLAMTAYADLDVSVIDQLPPGRKPVNTIAVGDARRDEVIARVAAACHEGRQVYWVCTLVEESELLQAEAATDTAERLASELGEVPLGLVHGRLKSAEKDRVMTAFKRGELRLLVATTVIEVGVDVPNASLMIIENAERLGLSQLHQLRGRVGRGAAQSTCVLMYRGPLSETARARLEVMRRSNDGFEIARRDLELRGPGEVLGTRQTGAAQFRIADLARDRHLLDAVGRAAARIMEREPERIAPLIRRWVGEDARYGGV